MYFNNYGVSYFLWDNNLIDLDTLDNLKIEDTPYSYITALLAEGYSELFGTLDDIHWVEKWSSFCGAAK